VKYHRSIGPGRKLSVRKAYLIVVLAALFSSLFLPIRCTGPLENICQALFAPPGRYTMLAARAVLGGETGSPGTDQSLMNEEQSRRLIAIRAELKKLEKENRELLGLREAIEPKFSLQRAYVVGFDSLGLRSTEITWGHYITDVKEKAPVLVGISEPIAQVSRIDPKIILASGALLGQIAYSPGPYTARVELITSSGVKFPAHIVRADPSGEEAEILTKVPQAVVGSGKDELLAAEVPVKYGVRPGDVVILAQPEEFGLPVALAVGKVAKLKPSTYSSLVNDVVITPFFKIYDLDKVYVLLKSSEPR